MKICVASYVYFNAVILDLTVLNSRLASKCDCLRVLTPFRPLLCLSLSKAEQSHLPPLQLSGLTQRCWDAIMGLTICSVLPSHLEQHLDSKFPLPQMCSCRIDRSSTLSGNSNYYFFIYILKMAVSFSRFDKI